MNARLLARWGVLSPCLFGLTSPAHAWDHTTVVWVAEDQPVPVRVADDGLDNSIEACTSSGGLSGCCEETVPAGACHDATRIAAERWTDPDCHALALDVRDGTVDPKEVALNTEIVLEGGEVSVLFNDWDNVSSEVGTAAVSLTRVGGELAFVLDGQIYTRAQATDIVFSNTADFLTDADVRNGACTTEFNLLSVMMHEMGHAVGLNHSCSDPFDPCDDPLLSNATMRYPMSPCDVELTDLDEDDLAGLSALYGPRIGISCSVEVGAIPLEVTCVTVPDETSLIDAVSWSFGDGGTSSDLEATHTYTAAGLYTVEAQFQGERAVCDAGRFEHTARISVPIRACAVPEPTFELEPLDGSRVRTFNESDLTVYGCVFEVLWEVFEGSEATGEPIGAPLTAWEPVLELPGPGIYTVRMTLEGVAGTGAAEATIEVEDTARGCGCASSRVALGVPALVLLAGIRRRRRTVT